MCTGPALFRWECLIAVRAKSAHRQQSGGAEKRIKRTQPDQAHATTVLAPGWGPCCRAQPRDGVLPVSHIHGWSPKVREIAKRAIAPRAERGRDRGHLAELLRCLHCADERGGVDDVKRAFGPELPAEGIGDARRVLVPAPRERGVKPLRIRFPALVPPDARHLVFTSPMGRGHEHGPRKKVYTKCCEW